jgi:hypothetical protein
VNRGQVLKFFDVFEQDQDRLMFTKKMAVMLNFSIRDLVVYVYMHSYQAGLIQGLTHLLRHGAASARSTAAGAVWALCVERGNKRYLAQNHDLLKAIAALINDVEAPVQAQVRSAIA